MSGIVAFIIKVNNIVGTASAVFTFFTFTSGIGSVLGLCKCINKNWLGDGLFWLFIYFITYVIGFLY